MNPARLAELHHQRALVREHLGWLEREIARESAGFVPPNTVKVPVEVPSLPTTPLQPSVEFEAYAPDPVSTVKETRRGCFMMLGVVVLLIAALLSAIYFWRYSDRPLFFPSSAPASDEAPSK